MCLSLPKLEAQAKMDGSRGGGGGDRRKGMSVGVTTDDEFSIDWI